MTDISKISNGTNTYDIKDATARTGLSNKQDTLVSGTNIKTINGTSLLGSGNIEVGGESSSYTAGNWINIDQNEISAKGDNNIDLLSRQKVYALLFTQSIGGETVQKLFYTFVDLDNAQIGDTFIAFDGETMKGNVYYKTSPTGDLEEFQWGGTSPYIYDGEKWENTNSPIYYLPENDSTYSLDGELIGTPGGNQ